MCRWQGNIKMILKTQYAKLWAVLNLLKTKFYLSDLRTQIVPRSKHSLPRI
jgi:hypothetical protein